MIRPKGEIRKSLENQLNIIAQRVYGKDTKNVIFRIKTEKLYENRRKLFIPGNGEIIAIELFPHITLSQKIEIDEKNENLLLEKVKKISKTKPFNLLANHLDDYGQNFTIFLAFDKNPNLDKLINGIKIEFKDPFLDAGEKRDIPHATLIYDDADEENFKKAWEVIDKNNLIGKQLSVNSLWLWKGWNPYKEIKLSL